MSRAYRITVKESETRHLKAGDEISTCLEILEILPPEDMATLLKNELKNRGFEEQEDMGAALAPLRSVREPVAA